MQRKTVLFCKFCSVLDSNRTRHLDPRTPLCLVLFSLFQGSYSVHDFEFDLCDDDRK